MRAMLDLLAGSRCAGCGAAASESPCDACTIALALSPPGNGAIWRDEGVPGRLVRSAKHGTWRAGGYVLASFANERLAGARYDLVTWVPADPARRARRGGCLPERFARAIAAARGIRARQLLRRTSAGTSQRGLDRDARVRNARDSYVADLRIDVGGLRVLLVDDVRTTGATLEVCAALLRERGAVVTTAAIVGVDRPEMRVARSAGVMNRETACGKPARSEDFLLTNGGTPADTLRHDQ